MRYLFLLIILTLSLTLCSCSGTSPVATDSTGELPQSTSVQKPLDSPVDSLLGAYAVKIDPVTAEVSLEPIQSRNAALGEQYLGDITGFLTAIYCSDCVQADGISLTPEGYVDLSISVKHPFNLPVAGPATAKNRLDLHLFDVWGLVFTDQGTTFDEAGITARPGFLVNADGYSGTYDQVMDTIVPTQNNQHPFKVIFEDSTTGNFDPQNLANGFVNPLEPSGYNVFPQGSDYKQTVFRFKPQADETIEFTLVLTASYGVSAKFGIADGEPGNRLNPRYFLPKFNRPEAWKVKVRVPSYLNFLTSQDSSQTAVVQVDAWDWQEGYHASSNWDFDTARAGTIALDSSIKYVALMIPDLFDGFVYANDTTGSGTKPRRFNIQVSNMKHALPGKYIGISSVIDQLDSEVSLMGFRRDGRTPFLYNNIRTYQFFEIEVKSSATAVPENPEDVTPHGLNGCLSDIVVKDNYAYASAGVLGILIFDISDPAKPKFISELQTNDIAKRIVLSPDGRYLLVADSQAGLTIVDVFNRRNPQIVGTYDTASLNDANDIALYSHYAYLSDASDGITVLDVSNPSSPELKGSYIIRPEVVAIDIEGSYLYKIDTNNGLEILSLADPINPTFANGLIISGQKIDVDVLGGVAVVLNRDRLVTADLSDPLAPALKGTVSFTAAAQSVFLADGFALVSNGLMGLYVFSVSDLSNPTNISSFNSPGNAKACYLSGNHVFLADSDGGLITLYAQAGGYLVFVGNYLTAGFAEGLEIGDQNLFVSSASSGIRSIYATTPENAITVGFADTPGYASDSVVRENMLYVADASEGVALINITSPSQPQYGTNIDFPDWDNWLATGIELDGTYAVVYGPQGNAAYPDMLILDATNKYNPVKVGDLSCPLTFYDLATQSGYVFAATGDGGILAVDASDPADLKGAGLYDIEKPTYAIYAENQNIYAMFTGLGLEVVTHLEPSNFQRVGGFAVMGNSDDIFISGKYAYSNNAYGMIIFDISDPTSPQPVSSFSIASTIHEIKVRGNYAYIAASDSGVRIIKLW